MDKQLWVVVCGAGTGEGAYAIRRGRYVIGRTKDCDIRVPHWSVSRHHADLVYKNGTLSVRDLGSRNGTRVNGKLVQVQQLTVPSMLAVGGVGLEVRDKFSLETQCDDELDTPGAFWRDGHADSLNTLSEHPLVRRRVGELLSKGLSEKRVAAILDVKECTVHYHVMILYRDFEVHSKGEFIARVLGRERNGDERARVR